MLGDAIGNDIGGAYRLLDSLGFDVSIVCENLYSPVVESYRVVRSPTAAEMAVACYTVAGDKVWEKTPGQFYARHGFCTHVVPYKDSIILNGDQDAEAYLVALNKETGSEKWRIDRPKRIRSYCAPLIVEAAGKTQMILTGAE